MEYITIAEFAKLAGVSKQAVYQRLNNVDLTSYVKLENGKKVINIKALSLFAGNIEDKSSNDDNVQAKQDSQELLKYLTRQNQDLNYQLNQLLLELQAERQENRNMKNELIEMSKSIIELTKQSNFLISQSHLLISSQNSTTINNPDSELKGIGNNIQADSQESKTSQSEQDIETGTSHKECYKNQGNNIIKKILTFFGKSNNV